MQRLEVSCAVRHVCIYICVYIYVVSRLRVNKKRARSQQIIGLQSIFMTGHKQRYCVSRMLKYLDA
jgi:hypothetical protein